MKLNEKGKELYKVWEQNYYKENDLLGGNSAEGDLIEGWSIVDNNDYIKNITDECGLLIFGYGEWAIETVEEWIDKWGNDTIGLFDFTYADVIKELLKYFE